MEMKFTFSCDRCGREDSDRVTLPDRESGLCADVQLPPKWKLIEIADKKHLICSQCVEDYEGKKKEIAHVVNDFWDSFMWMEEPCTVI